MSKTGYTEVGGGSCLGKQIAVLTGKKYSTLEIYEGGIKVINHRNACCGCSPCLGWTIGYEVIPKQCIVNISVEARSRCCCCPCCCMENCCHYKTTVVVFEILTKGNSPNKFECVLFSWNKDELKDKAEILHNYVYGSVAGQGIVNDAHNLAHFVNQGIVIPSAAPMKLS